MDKPKNSSVTRITRRDPKPRLVFERMEPRLLLSADALGGVVTSDHLQESQPSTLDLQQSLEMIAAEATPYSAVDSLSLESIGDLLSDQTQSAQRQEVIFVDADTPGYQQLIDGIQQDSTTQYHVVVIESAVDGIQQINEHLSGLQSIDAIHLVSHANGSGIQLGSSWLSTDSLAAYSEQLASWSTALTEQADILIYGCNLASGEAGVSLINQLAALTGADVAASDDLTGDYELGGDWDLEYTTGDIESDIAFSNDSRIQWNFTLAADSLFLSTAFDVSGSTTPGLASWTAGEVIEFADPNLTFDPTGVPADTTDGTFSSIVNMDLFDPSGSGGDDDVYVAAMHYVSQNLTVGTTFTFDLQAGDLIMAISPSPDANETLTSTNSIVVQKSDVFVFRPDTPGDYSAGNFYMLLDDFTSSSRKVSGISLVEQDTTVGSTTLTAGTFLFTQKGDGTLLSNDIHIFTNVEVGAGTTSGTRQVLIDGSDIGITGDITGIDLIETDTTIGGTTLSAGTILAVNDVSESVGNNLQPVTPYDVFSLSITQSDLDGAGPPYTTVGDAALFFDGSDVNLTNLNQEVSALTLVDSTGGGGNSAPTATNLNSTSAYNEDDVTVSITDIVVSDVNTGDTITATLTLANTATGSLSANDGATYTAGTGVWTITDTVANVNTALANLVFNPNTNNDIDTTINTHIEDAAGAGPADGTINLNVTASNDAPTATNLSSTSVYNAGDASVAITDIVVSDVDTGETITATLTLANTATGSLSANDGATYNAGTGVWTITDTVANVNTALANLVFNPVVTNVIDTTISVSIDDGDEDGSGSLTGTINLNLSPVNNAPTANGLNSTHSYFSTDSSVPLNDIVVADADSNEQITASLTLGNTSAGALTSNDGASYNATTGVWTITGTVAQVNAALANVSFIPSTDNTVDSSIQVSIDDGDEDGSGALLGTLQLDVTPVVLTTELIEEAQAEDIATTADEEPAAEAEIIVTEEVVNTDIIDEQVTPAQSGAAVVDTVSSESRAVVIEDQVVLQQAGDEVIDLLGVSTKDTGDNEKSVQVTETSVSRLRDQLAAFNDPFQLLNTERFIMKLNDMRQELVMEQEDTDKVVGGSMAVSAGISVGYVVWLARSGVLMSSMLSALPAWRFIDPLPVLATLQAGDLVEDDESLESMVEDKTINKEKDAEI